MKPFLVALALLLVASRASAANYVESFTHDEGLTLYAFSFNEADFDDWVADRVAVTGGTTGLYSVTLDSANGTRFAIFEGATTPTSWDDAALIADITDRVELDALPTAAETITALLATTTTDTGANTFGRAIHNLRQFFGASTTGVGSTAGLVNAPSGGGGGGTLTPRINRKPAPAFTFKVSRRADGTYECTSKLRIVPGTVETLYPAIDMSPLFGPDNYVDTVGTPAISGGSITVAAEGPRDTYAFIEVDGTATASEERTITVPITMESGDVVQVKLYVVVFAS